MASEGDGGMAKEEERCEKSEEGVWWGWGFARGGPGEARLEGKKDGLCWNGRREARDEATEAATDDGVDVDCWGMLRLSEEGGGEDVGDSWDVGGTTGEGGAFCGGPRMGGAESNTVMDCWGLSGRGGDVKGGWEGLDMEFNEAVDEMTHTGLSSSSSTSSSSIVAVVTAAAAAGEDVVIAAGVGVWVVMAVVGGAATSDWDWWVRRWALREERWVAW